MASENAIARGDTRNVARPFHWPPGSSDARHTYTLAAEAIAAASDARDALRNSTSAAIPITTGKTTSTASGCIDAASPLDSKLDTTPAASGASPPRVAHASSFLSSVIFAFNNLETGQPAFAFSAAFSNAC